MADGHPSKVGEATAGEVSDEARTHLLLDAVCLEEEAQPAPPGPLREASLSGLTREERTRLMLGPVVLKEDPLAMLSAPADGQAWLTRGLRWMGDRIDVLMHDRWLLALAAAAIGAGVVPPLGADQPWGAGVRRAASVALLIGGGAFGVLWASQLQNARGNVSFGAGWARLVGAARLLALDVREPRGAALHLEAIRWGRLLSRVGFVALLAASALGLDGSDPLAALRVPAAVLLLVGIALRLIGPRVAVVAAAPEELKETVGAAKKMAALIDLDDELPPSFIDGHTPLHRVLIALSQWRAGPWPDAAGYRGALERHLRRHLPVSKIEREKWLGRSRVDGVAPIAIDELVAVEVTRGFSPSDAARALARLGDLGRGWSGKPIVLVVFESPREPVFQSVATASLIELHERFSLVTVRMPARGL